ncbi:MAG: hypothetical protein IPM63_03995 [Acidobacteriota bacterium]|nr:MAG: hypothetical protein IPM63_03995 [Acidobacteriota bacterium]
MPVSIYRVTIEGEEDEYLAWLCDDEWELAPQGGALSDWLEECSDELEPAQYVAAISVGWRRDAGGGGPEFGPETLRRMADLGMSLFISEYAGFTDDLSDTKTGESGDA